MKTRKSIKLKKKEQVEKQDEKQNIVDRTTGEVNKPTIRNFMLQQLVMKRGTWEMHILINSILNIINKNYHLTFVVDLEEIDEKINDALDELHESQINIEGVSEAEEKHNQLLNAKEELIQNCPDILLDASVLSSKYISGETAMVFHISAEIINMLNDKRLYMDCYKLKMEPFNS